MCSMVEGACNAESPLRQHFVLLPPRSGEDTLPYFADTIFPLPALSRR
jgi:hypothetical protein